MRLPPFEFGAALVQRAQGGLEGLRLLLELLRATLDVAA